MQHFISLPVLVPMLAGVLLLLPPCGKNLIARRIVSVIMSFLALGVSAYLLNVSLAGQINVYAIGNWQAPFGIVLVADVMSSLLVTLTSLLTLICVIYSLSGDDEEGSFFHPLIHFLLLGVNGAFLTAIREASSDTVIVSLIRTSRVTSCVGFWKPCCND